MTSMKPLVIIPTYNERENLETIVQRARTAAPDIHILIADDASPDGTGQIADEMAAKDDHIHVMHRAGKQGLGAAYLAGFEWGGEHGYDVLIEMDADGSHPPQRLPALLESVAGGADLAIGSRWVHGGRVVNWPKKRELLSRGGSLYTRLMLGISIRDTTAGFRAYRRSALAAMDLETVESHGYCFQIDMTWRAVQSGLTIVEIPITFTERELGASKMSQNIVTEALMRVTRWGIKHRIAQVTSLVRRRKDT